MGVRNFILFCFGFVCVCCTGEHLGWCACVPSYRSQSEPLGIFVCRCTPHGLEKGSLASSEVQFGLGWCSASSQLSSACPALAGC